MNGTARFSALLLFLSLPAICNAQNMGQVQCAQSGDYIYLYSSITTLEVRARLACGQQVQITGRYDLYVSVRTERGEVGFVSLDNIQFLRAKPVAKSPRSQSSKAATGASKREPATGKEVAAIAPIPELALLLLDGTPVHLKLGKTISSADAQVGEELNFEVSEDLVVDGLVVIPKGATANGVVNEAEPKKRLGRGGKLSVIVNYVRLSDSEKAGLRAVGEGKGSGSGASPLKSGKDVVFAQGTEFTAFVNGDMRLKRGNFHAATDSSGTAPAASAQNPSQPRD